ncbi:MAG: hypothetical protein ACHQHN_10100 [Sphingobacteriales bacterium]
MKKLILLLCIFCCLKVYAQVPTTTNTAFSLGGELSIPSYGLYSIGTGLSAKFETPIVSPLSLSVTAGFMSVFYKSNLLYNAASPGAGLFAPVKAGLKYYLVQSVYAEGEAGTAIELNHNKQDLFAFSFGLGFLAPIGEKRAIDISFRYEDWQGELKQTALRFAYRFGR